MVQQGWFQIQSLGDGMTLIAEPLHEEGVKSYLVEGERDVAVIDTGLGVADFAALVADISDRDPIVLQTHGHWDHIGHTWAFGRRLIHPSEAYTLRRGFANALYKPLFSPKRLRGAALPESFDPETAEIPPCEPTGELEHGDVVELGGRALEVFHTPGHSPGGLSFLDRGTRTLFAGDAINYGGIWLFLPRSDAAAYRATLRLLAELADELVAVYPSHQKAPRPPEHLRLAHEAFEEVWAGRTPERKLRWDIGFPEKVPVDQHDVGEFRFLLREGAYGEGRQTG